MLGLAFAAVFALRPEPGHVGPPTVVTTSTDPVPGVNGVCSLREAILANNANGALYDCDGTNGPITFLLGGGTPVINIAAGNPLPALTMNNVGILGTSGGADRVEIRGPGGHWSAGTTG